MRNNLSTDTPVILSAPPASGIAGFPLRIILICLLFCCYSIAEGQVSYGGRPLEPGAEIKSNIRSAADYFVEMQAVNTDSLLEIDALSGNRIGGLKFAHTFFTDLSPENSGITFFTEDGTRVWKVGIRSKGAFSLNVLFNEFQLPDGAEVFLYNADRSCLLGAFTNKNRPEGGEFSVAPVEGDELTVEYHEPSDVAFSGNIRITEINHDYLGIFRVGTRFNQLNLPCLPDVSCETAYDTLSRSVCLLIINGSIFCTGTLLNNTARNGKPYLLTASHCLQNNASYGSRVVAFMNYKSPRCDKRIRGSEEFSVSGSKTKALSNEVDFALLELNEMPPADYRPYLAGWSTDTTTKDVPYTGLHHPYGEVMKYSIENDSITKTNWVGTTDGIARGNHWLINQWETGHTWSGSSGSPLFDNLLRLRGALTGGDSGGLSGCDSIYVGDFYFRFNRAWNQFTDSTKQLKHWLDPGTPDSISQIVQINGMDPYSDNPARRISNIVPSDSLGIVSANPPNLGSLFGQNSYGTSQYAEHFTSADSCMIQGVYLMVAKGTNNSRAPVTLRVYMGGEQPGSTLATAVLNPNYTEYINGRFSTVKKATFSNRENYLRFETPISVGTDFYVGYQVYYPITTAEDSFYVYSAIRTGQTINSAFYKNDLFWYPFSEHNYKPLSTSLWIEPVVLRNTTSSDTTPDTTNNGHDSIRFNQPLIIYSEQESMLCLWFTNDWTSETRVEIFDLYGRLIKKTKVTPPTATFSFKPMKGQLYLIRLNSGNKSFTSKLLVR